MLLIKILKRVLDKLQNRDYILPNKTNLKKIRPFHIGNKQFFLTLCLKKVILETEFIY